MKTFKLMIAVFLILGIALGNEAFALTAKYSEPGANVLGGVITSYPKGHTGTSNYTPGQTVNYDKQHKAFQNSLTPQNLRR